MTTFNTNLILISGESKTGKTSSLRNFPRPEGVMYLNCEANKPLPFPAKFKQYTITDPLLVYGAFDAAEKKKDIHTIVVDSITFLMDMYESIYVIDSPNTMKAWGDYNQFFKKLMQQYVAKSTKNIIFLAHTLAIMNDDEMILSRQVPIKGALKGVGIESFFSLVISSKVVETSKLEKYKNLLLTITPEEEMLKMKHVFQTKLTKETVHDRIGSPIGMFTTEETYTDNDIASILQRVQKYYK